MRRYFGHIEKTGAGAYRVFWSENGVKRSHRLHGSRADAEKYLAKVESGIVGYGDSVSYSDYWGSAVSMQISKLQEKTSAEYRRLWSRNLEPHIGGIKISATTYPLVQSVIDKTNGAAQKRAVARLWSKVCNMAIRDGIIDRNPVKGIIFPKNNPKPKTILPPSEVLLYIDYARASKYAHIVLLELCVGLRHEEACAVTSDDIRISGDTAYINIDKARVSVNGRIVEKDTKNSYSSRAVPVCGSIARLLGALTVEPVNPQTASHNWRAWCKRHELQYVPFGQMRTNFITHACECAPTSLVDLYVGHSDGSVRMKHYQKATEQGLLAVAEAYAEYIAEK